MEADQRLRSGRKAGSGSCGYRGTLWEECGGSDMVAMDLDGGDGFICLSQATHSGRCTYGAPYEALWVVMLSQRDSVWAVSDLTMRSLGVAAWRCMCSFHCTPVWFCLFASE